MTAHIHGPVPQQFQLLQKGGRVPALIPAQRLVKVRVPGVGPDLCEPVRRKAVERGTQHRDEGNVLPGIVDDLEVRKGHRHLSGVQKILSPIRLPGNIPFSQRPGIVVKHRPRRAQKNDDIPRRHRPQAAVLIDDLESLLQERLDAACGKAGLQQIPGGLLSLFLAGLGEVQGIQLHTVVPPVLFEGCAGIEGLIPGVVHLAELRGHHVSEEEIGSLQHLGPGAEIPCQKDAPGLALRRLTRRAERAVLLQEDGGVGQSEAIDGLFHVPHHK